MALQLHEHKAVIDILMEVPDLQQLDARVAALAALGYEAKGEFGIPGRRYFRLDNAGGVRTSVAMAYGMLKARLAREFATDPNAYMDGKDDFIKEHEAKALHWRSP
jgi:GrpB-like predicted nucleotidyltransferase (UPF0157 family)